jgi:HSP20 family molecular chaperone IbpA
MSLFSRNMHLSEPRYGSFSRFLEDIAHYPRSIAGRSTEHEAVTSFQPSFDVRELSDAYELHGELPGLDREDISIEFIEPQTLIIHGKVERSYTVVEPPAGILESPESSEPEAGTKKENRPDDSKDTPPSPKSKAANAKDPKFWVAERSVGQFSRTFSFPHHIQQDGVVASLDRGILSVKVPKSENTQIHRIQIN